MFKVWQDFLTNPQVFISSTAAAISVLTLIFQYILFKLNGSKIKIDMSLSFYELETNKTFNYPIYSSRKMYFLTQ